MLHSFNEKNNVFVLNGGLCYILFKSKNKAIYINLSIMKYSLVFWSKIWICDFYAPDIWKMGGALRVAFVCVSVRACVCLSDFVSAPYLIEYKGY